ncbi:phage holin family protein [Noviherbaspirillum sp.]|uniref:phage holin family protein n=1 Tax=Noviherbaspirillum sp. TaxID=1926288 RepID=UPI002FE1CFA4
MNAVDKPASGATPIPAGGLAAGLAGMGKNLFGLLVSRVELAACELGEIRSHLLKLLLLFGIGVVVVWFAIAYWTALIVVLAWDSWGWKILLLMAAVFTLLAAGLLFYARALLSANKLSMPATMAELRNDRDALL